MVLPRTSHGRTSVSNLVFACLASSARGVGGPRCRTPTRPRGLRGLRSGTGSPAGVHHGKTHDRPPVQVGRDDEPRISDDAITGKNESRHRRRVALWGREEVSTHVLSSFRPATTRPDGHAVRQDTHQERPA